MASLAESNRKVDWMVSLPRYWCRAPTQSLGTIPGSRQAFWLDRARRAGGRIACGAAAKFYIPPGSAVAAVKPTLCAECRY